MRLLGTGVIVSWRHLGPACPGIVFEGLQGSLYRPPASRYGLKLSFFGTWKDKTGNWLSHVCRKPVHVGVGLQEFDLKKFNYFDFEIF